MEMQRTGRDNAVCFESLEQALENSPETYRHLDLIAFGFPCQDISNANPKGKGLSGERSSIFFECMRIVNLLVPQWLLIENVPRLLSINNGRDMATVLYTLGKSGYGWAYRLLDSQYFGVPQRRRRVFIVGYFGGLCPPEVLFEPKGRGGDNKEKPEMGKRGLCLSTRDGERNDPTTETLVASTVGTSTNPDPNYGTHFVAQTIGNTPKGNTSFVWQDTYIAEINAEREGKTTGIPRGLDSCRGIVIGNAVTINVAEWIGKRIASYQPEMEVR